MSKTSVSVFEDDWRLIDELMHEGTINVSDDEDIEPPGKTLAGWKLQHIPAAIL